MIILDCKQLEQEWMQARTGIPTASNFDKIITTKGEPSKQRKKYMFQLAGERITGIKEETYQNAAMLRGIEMENDARSLYELITDTNVKTVGLCYPDDKKLIGASPDGLVGDEGGIEIKCPTLAVHVGYLLDNKLPTAYFAQVQGALSVAGRNWWDFMSYYPGLRPLIIRAERDEQFIGALKFELDLFCKELDIITNKIK